MNRWETWQERSDVEQEVQHIAVLHHVFLAFCTHLAGILGALLALVGNEIVKGNGLRADETAFKIAVNHAGRLGRRVADMDGQARTSFTPAVK